MVNSHYKMKLHSKNKIHNQSNNTGIWKVWVSHCPYKIFQDTFLSNPESWWMKAELTNSLRLSQEYKNWGVLSFFFKRGSNVIKHEKWQEWVIGSIINTPGNANCTQIKKSNQWWRYWKMGWWCTWVKVYPLKILVAKFARFRNVLLFLRAMTK